MLINGSLQGKFVGSRGLRKDDPLSSSFFAVTADVPSRMMEKAADGALFKLLSVGRSHVPISQLQYADDAFFLGLPDEESVSNILITLNVICLILGLKVNEEIFDFGH